MDRTVAHWCTFCGSSFAGLPLLAVNTGCPYCGGMLEPIVEETSA